MTTLFCGVYNIKLIVIAMCTLTFSCIEVCKVNLYVRRL